MGRILVTMGLCALLGCSAGGASAPNGAGSGDASNPAAAVGNVCSGSTCPDSSAACTGPSCPSSGSVSPGDACTSGTCASPDGACIGINCPGSTPAMGPACPGGNCPGSDNACPSGNCPGNAGPGDACAGGNCPGSVNACPTGNCPGFAGNGPVDAGAPDAYLPTIDLPFSYQIVDGGVQINTEGGLVYASVGPWGAHFAPNTGHELGDSKSNIAAFFVDDLTTLTQTDGSPCTLGAQCQVAESVVAGRRPTYVAPIDGAITRVSFSPPVANVYYPDGRHFQVEFHGGGYSIVFDHVYATADSLRQKILAATGIDTNTWEPDGGSGTLELNIPVSAHDEVAHPQIAGLPSPNAGYLIGGGEYPIPWAQMEVFVTSEATGYDICLYDHVDPATKRALQSQLDAQMSSVTSVRYAAPQYGGTKWLWGAEGSICLEPSVAPSDYSGLFTHLGGTWWSVQSSPGTPQAIAFPHIVTSSPAYASALYSAGVDTLMVLARPNQPGEPPFVFPTPEGGTVQATIVFGELLSLGSGDMLVHWRQFTGQGLMNNNPPDVYQRVAYDVDASTGLKLRWGTPSNDATAATVAALSPSDSCDGTVVICYDHTESPLY